MYIQHNQSINKKTGKVYKSAILCSKYREGGKIKTRTISNLSHLPDKVLLTIQNTLKSEKEATVALKEIKINDCIDYGYLLVILQMMKQLRINEVLEKTLAEDDATLVKAMIAGKIINSGSKLSIFNWLDCNPKISNKLGVDTANSKVDRLYTALGQLCGHQEKIEKKWFRYHRGASRRIYLYDLTSTYFEGSQNYFAEYGYNRDGKKGKKQMCIGLLTAEDGFPLRIEAFAGNTADSTTVAKQISALKNTFGVKDVVFVGDRGMHISYNLENDPQLVNEKINFITGLTHNQIQTLIAQDTLQLGLFNSELAEVALEDGKRYILSVNPDLEAKELYFLNNRKQECDTLLENIRKSWEKRCEKNQENIQKKKEKDKKIRYRNLKTEMSEKDINAYIRRVENIINKASMKKYYTVEIIDNRLFSINFDASEFEKTTNLCGKYVVYTNIPVQDLSTSDVRNKYKKLQNVEHAFRDLKSDNISIRPVYHVNELQTRGHVMLCMFAYTIIKSLEDKLFPFLKEYNKTNKTQYSFDVLTAELNKIKICELHIGNGIKSIQFPNLNPLQKKILELLNVKLTV